MIKDQFPVDLVFKIQKELNLLNKECLKKTKFYKSKKKNEIDPVTKQDIKIEKFLRKSISKLYPNHSILGEEFKEKKKFSKYTWILDPIDGTKNMIMGLPSWSNLIGLYKENIPLMGYANFPILKKQYIAFENKTFLLENKKILKINSNKKATVKNAKLVINTFHTLKHAKIYKMIKNYNRFFKITGIDAYNFCLIAEGKIDVLIESGLKMVDIKPLVAIIKNSGAIISDWEGKMIFKGGKVLVASNKKLHNFFLKSINK
ncbi:inositol monophosphatase family protein [Candidatus Pelagibacter sp. HIMB123]|uniref:inositol monophosphatase family protein n=1 Tax=Candidatus Pelagibacter sp. HIMB123 TaxID=3415413 RepID=UPI003F875775